MPLQPRPFDLLLYLIAHRDRVVPREELLEQVWDVAVGSQALGVAVHALRKALADDGATQAIVRTIRGSGFQFTAPVISMPSLLTEERLRSRHRDAVMLGRSDLLAEVEEALLDAERGEARIFLLQGEAGIGKSHAIEHLAAMAVRQGFQVFGGRCADADAAGAFEPWQQIAQEITKGQSEKQVAEWLGVEPNEIAWLSSDLKSRKPDRAEHRWLTEGVRSRLFALFVALLKRVSLSRPLFLSLDDIHRADAGSMAFFEYLLERKNEVRMVLIASYRHLARNLRVRLEHRGRDRTGRQSLRCLALSGLNSHDVRELFQALTGVRVRSDTAVALQERTAGNPFFLTQLSNVLVAEDRLPLLAPGHLDALSLPTQVHETIMMRLDELPSSSIRALQFASIAGREFMAADIASALGVTHHELISLLDPPMQAHIIARAELPNCYAFVHVLVRDAIVATLEDHAKCTLHAQLARGIEEQVEGREWLRASELAHHYLEAVPVSGPGPAVDYLELAAEWATHNLGYEDAAQHLQAAIDLQLSAQPAQLARLLAKQASTLLQLGRRAEAEEKYREAAAISRRARLPAQLAEIALGYSPDFLAIETGVVDFHHVSLLEEALSYEDAHDPLTKSRLQARLGVALHWGDRDLRVATAIACESQRQARLSGNLEAIASANVSSAFTSFSVAKPERLLKIRPETINALDRSTALIARILRVTAHWLLGDTARLRTEIEDFDRAAHQLQSSRAFWYTPLWKSALALMEGDLDRANRYQARFIEIGESIGDRNVVHSQALQQFLASRDWGGVETLGPAIDKLIDNYPLVSGWRAGRLLYLIETNQLDNASDELTLLFEENVLGKPRRNDWFGLAVAVSIASCKLKDADKARWVYERLAPHRNQLVVLGYGSFCLGSVEGFLGVSAIGFGEHALARTHLLAALDRNRRANARPAVARVLLHLSQLERDVGNADASHSWCATGLNLSTRLRMRRLRRLFVEEAEASESFG